MARATVTRSIKVGTEIHGSLNLYVVVKVLKHAYRVKDSVTGKELDIWSWEVFEDGGFYCTTAH